MLGFAPIASLPLADDSSASSGGGGGSVTPPPTPQVQSIIGSVRIYGGQAQEGH